MWVPCRHVTARPQVADGAAGLQTWRVAANILNILNKQRLRNIPPAWGLGYKLTVKNKVVTKCQKAPRTLTDLHKRLKLKKMDVRIVT
jgi:hypothetical protein